MIATRLNIKFKQNAKILKERLMPKKILRAKKAVNQVVIVEFCLQILKVIIMKVNMKKIYNYNKYQ